MKYISLESYVRSLNNTAMSCLISSLSLNYLYDFVKYLLLFYFPPFVLDFYFICFVFRFLKDDPYVGWVYLGLNFDLTSFCLVIKHNLLYIVMVLENHLRNGFSNENGGNERKKYLLKCYVCLYFKDTVVNGLSLWLSGNCWYDLHFWKGFFTKFMVDGWFAACANSRNSHMYDKRSLLNTFHPWSLKSKKQK